MADWTMEQVDHALVKANAARDRTAIDWLSQKKRELYTTQQEQAAAIAPQAPEGGILSGILEPIAAVGSGTAATVEGGWAGLGNAALSLPQGRPLEGFREAFNAVAQAGTYQPKTKSGQSVLNVIDTIFGAAGNLGRGAGHLAGKATGGNPYVEEAVGAPLGMAGDALTAWLTGRLGAGLGGGVRLPGRGYEANAVDLARRGTRVTPGQARGGDTKVKEQQMTSDPLLGEAVRQGQQRALESYQRTTLNEALRLIRPGTRAAPPPRGGPPPAGGGGGNPTAAGGGPAPGGGPGPRPGPRQQGPRPRQSGSRRAGQTYPGTATPVNRATGAQLPVNAEGAVNRNALPAIMAQPIPRLPAPTRGPTRGGRQGQLVRGTIQQGRDQGRLTFQPPPRRLTHQPPPAPYQRYRRPDRTVKGRPDVIKLPRTKAQIRSDIDAQGAWPLRWAQEVSARLAKANGVTKENVGQFTHYKVGDAKMAKLWQELYDKGVKSRTPLERANLIPELDRLGALTQDKVNPGGGTKSAFELYEAEQLAKEQAHQAAIDAHAAHQVASNPNSIDWLIPPEKVKALQTPPQRVPEAPPERRAATFAKLPPAMQAFLKKGKPVGPAPPPAAPPSGGGEPPPGPGGEGIHGAVMGVHLPPEAGLGVGNPGVRSGGMPQMPAPPAAGPIPGSARGTGARGRPPGGGGTAAPPPGRGRAPRGGGGQPPPLRVPEHLTGHEAVRWTYEHVNRFYSNAVSHLRGDYDSAPRGGQSLRAEIAGHRNVLNQANISADARAEGLRVLDQIDRTFGPGGRIAGSSMQNLIEFLRTRKEYFMNQDRHPDVRSLGLMIDDIRDGIDAMIGRTNTVVRASDYAAARKAYSIFKPAENAAAAPNTGLGSSPQDASPRGVPTATRYSTEVRRADASRNRRQWAQGTAGPTIPPVRPRARREVPLQTLAEQGTAVMGDVYPNSGTPGRGALQHLISEPWTAANLVKLLALPGVRRRYSEAGLRRLHERILRRGTGPHYVRDDPDLLNLVQAAFSTVPQGANTAASLPPETLGPGISANASQEDQVKAALKYMNATPQQ